MSTPSPEQEPRSTPAGAGKNGNVPPVEFRWKKGQSGNPGGRPKGQSLIARMREVLEREHAGRELADLLAERFVKEAMSGKFPFAKELLDRLEGPVTQKQEVKVRGGALEQIRDLAATLTDEELIQDATRLGQLDALPPRLRMIAQRMEQERKTGRPDG